MKVIQFQRRRPPGKFSLEGYFSQVRSRLSGAADVSVQVLPFLSRGVWRRALNMLSVAWKQADINHITGDVHYISLLMKRERTILTVPDCEILTRLNGWRRAIVKFGWYTLPARRVAAITVISDETKLQLLREIDFSPEAIHVIPVSVSELFQPSPAVFNSVKPRILQVGTKANKNLIRLAEALQGLDCQLDVVGVLSDSQREALAEYDISFTNYVDLSDVEIVDRYREADVVSFVSTYEGFGMPIVEAQSMERVCVTSNCSSMPEVAGDGACLVDPFDVESIRDGFVRVMQDSDYRESLVERGRVNRLRYDPERIAEQYLSLYQSLCSSKNEN